MFAYTKLMQAMAAAGVVSATDPYFNLTTLLLNTSSTNGAQNNTFLDSSTNNFTITRNGNTTQGTFTPFSQTGWSNYFDGSSYLTPSSSPMALGSGAYTVEFWIYPTLLAAGSYHVLAANATNGFVVVISNAKISINKFGTGDVLAYNTSLALNTWTHVALVRTGTGANQTQIYVNGTSVATGTDSNNWTVTSTTAIGANSSGTPSQYISGYLSNLRICSAAVYTSTFTPSTTALTTTSQGASGCTFLTCQNNRFIDNGSTAATFTTGGTPSIQAFSPFAPTVAYDAAVVGGSAYFDGSGDYLTFTDSANDLDLGGLVASFEAWVYPTSTANYQHLIYKSGGALSWSASNGIEYAVAFDVNKFYFVYNVSGAATFVNGTSGKAPNQWYHIAVATDASNNIALFVNGVREGTATNAITKPTTRTTINVGANPSGTETIYGYICGQRFIKGSGAYDPTQTTITVPTSAPTAVTNTKLLLNYTNSGIYDSTAKNVLETVGNAQVSTTQAKWGTTSMSFDGTGDSLKGKLNNAIGGGDYTIEGWLYTGASGARYIFDMRETSQYLGAFTSGTTLYVNIGTTLDIVATTSFTQNAWVHFAMVRSGSATNNTSVFFNGSRVTQVTDTTNYSIIPTLYVGNDNTGSYSWNGYIDDFRITKGYARYSGSTYTVPTAAFPLQ